MLNTQNSGQPRPSLIKLDRDTMQGGQIVMAKFLDCMCLALRALRTMALLCKLQNLPSGNLESAAWPAVGRGRHVQRFDTPLHVTN